MDCENPQILKLIRLVAQSAWRHERDGPCRIPEGLQVRNRRCDNSKLLSS